MILLVGGARSGKSATAVRLATESGADVTFIATAVPDDAEMTLRIERHRQERPSKWTTVEAPVDLRSAVAAADVTDFLIVDCLTLWVSNFLAEGRTVDDLMADARCVASLLHSRRAVVVSNEVGLGIVPANELSRLFRDTLGIVNATFAAAATGTLLMIAGQGLALQSVNELIAPE